MVQDVQEDLAVAMARELELEGTCVRVVPATPAQGVVDVSWAARRAGRMIGRRVRTSVTELSRAARGEVAVVAVVEQPRPRPIAEQRPPLD